jgi:heptosyltransferase-3
MQRGRRTNRLLDFWLGTPLLNLLAIFHRKRAAPTHIARIGILCSPALGDTLLLSGVLRDLRAAFPQARLTHICMKQNLAAAEVITGADERLLIDLTRPRETIRSLRARHFDVLLDFSSWQRLTAFYVLLSGAGYTVGFRTPGMHRGRGYDLAVDHTSDRHELENFRTLLSSSGIVSPPVPPSEPVVVACSEISEPLAAEHDIVVFHPWASGQNSSLREWPEDRWIALARRLQQADTFFVITGAPSELSRTTPMVDRMNAAGLHAAPFVSPDGFRSLTCLLLRARIVVSVNTGVMHLAAIAGAPTLALNGPTAEHRWGARGLRVANVQPADGSGGYLHLGFEFKGQPHDVMQRISVDQVVAATEQLLATPPLHPNH